MTRVIRILLAVAVLLLIYPLSPGRAEDWYDRNPLEEKDDFRTLSEDVIDIQVVGRKIIAIQKGETILARELGLNEEILQLGARGRLGVVMTNKRLLVVSSFTSDWIELALLIEELEGGRKPRVLTSDFLVLVVTRQRLLGFDSQRNVWVKTDIPVHDEGIRSLINKRVAVAYTSEKAWGFAFGSPFFTPERFLVGETMLSVDTTPFTVNIRTNKRLLVFKAATATWREIDSAIY